MATNSTTVKIKGKEDVSKAATKAGKSIKQLAHEADQAGMKSKSAGGQFAAFKGGLLAVSAAAVAVGVALKKAFDFAEMGAQIKQTKQAFANMASAAGEDADTIMSSLMEMTRGTVSEMDLMASASRAAVLGLPVDELDRLMQIAMASSQATGESTTKMFSDIVLGLGRQSKLILDNLGILINVEQANAKYAETLGKTSAELSDAEKKQAFFNATLEAGESIVERVGLDMSELTDAQQWQRMRSEVENLKTSLKGMLNSMLTPIVAKIGAALTHMRLAQELADEIRRDMEATTGRNRNILPQPSEVDRIKAEIEEMLAGAGGGVWGADSPDVAAQANLAAYRRIVDYLLEIKGEHKDIGIVVGGVKAPLQELLEQYQKLLKTSEATAKKAQEWVLIEQVLADIGAKIPLTVDEQRLALESQITALETWVGWWAAGTDEAHALSRVIAYLNGQLRDMLGTTEKQTSLWAKYGELITKIWKSGGGPRDYGPTGGTQQQINTDMSGAVWGAGDMDFGTIMETSVTDFFSGGGFDFGSIVQDAFTQGMPEGVELSEELQQQADNLGAFGEAILNTTIASAGLAGKFIENIMAMGELGILYTLLEPVIRGLFSVLAPAMDAVLLPLFSALFSIAQVAGVLLTPIFAGLVPVMDALLTGIMMLIEPISMVLAPIMDALGWVLETLVVPVIKVFASLLIGLSAPIQLLADVFGFVGDILATFAHNVQAFFTIGMEAKEYKTYDETGGRTWAEIWAEVEARQAELWATGGGTGGGGGTADTLADLWAGFDWDTFEFPELETYGGGGGGGGGPSSHTTVQHAPDVYVTINANAIVGTGGAIQVAEYVADAIGELLGTGARITWLEAE